MPSQMRMPKGLPRHFEAAPFLGRKQRFNWGHDLPGTSAGGIQYIPSLDVMCMTPGVGNVQLRDPVTAEVLYEFLLTLVTDGALSAAYVPTANKLVVPIYENGNGNRVVLINLNNGSSTVIGSLSLGTYQACYCPINDLVYVTGWQSNMVHVFNPWTDTLVTTITGFGGITLGMTYCPLNGKLYALSRNSNTAQKIDPTTNTFTSFATGGAYDEIFYSDNLRKMVIVSAGGSTTYKTIDSSDVVASTGIAGGTAFGGVSVPTTGETVVMDNGLQLLRFLDQTGAQITTITMAGFKYAGWNPVTKRIWVTDGNSRQVYEVDPVARTLMQTNAIIRTN